MTAGAIEVFLGTHKAHWLGLVDVPLFVSVRTLRKRKKLPRARARWALDSGGFTELNKSGAWETSPKQYVEELRRISSEIGSLAWASAQDWMCEPFVLQKTGLSIADHQRLTVENYLELKSLAPEIPITPVVQGYTADDYLRCVEMYSRRGVNLQDEPIVGVGTMGRRQGKKEQEAHKILWQLHSLGLRLHAFEFKKQGLLMSRRFLASSDSLAWSYDARRNQAVRCGGDHASCANCLTFALQWRRSLMGVIDAHNSQQELFAS